MKNVRTSFQIFNFPTVTNPQVLISFFNFLHARIRPFILKNVCLSI